MYNRLKIAFLTSVDPLNKRSWSGTCYYMLKALQKHCGEVTALGPVKPKILTFGRIFNKVLSLTIKKKYSYEHSIYLAKRYAEIFNRKISQDSFDIVFAPAASTEIALLDRKIPIVYVSDSTFTLSTNYYPLYTNLLKVSVREGIFLEKLAIKNASLILYPSGWAAQSAIRDFQTEKAKIRIVPFGANLEEIPSKEVILAREKSDACRLLFIGVDWERKGGDIALEALTKLQEHGLPAELVICGCTPPKMSSDAGVTVIPYLDKNDEAQRKKLNHLLLTSDFLLLPTRSECYGIAFCEASAYGLPVLATDTGGVSGAVKHGENGFMLPIGARGCDFAELIYELYRDDERYYSLRRTSRRAFDERLNWDAWAVKLRKLIGQIL